MPETILYQSRILLFGQKIDDLKIEPTLPEGTERVRAATVDESDRNGEGNEDGVGVEAGQLVLVKDQENERENGIHTVVAQAQGGGGGDWNRDENIPDGRVVYVEEGAVNGGSLWVLMRKPPAAGNNPRYTAEPYQRPVAFGQNRQLADQFFFLGARFAKIYGFSYEGRYYDLARPTVFMVHGDGELVTEAEQANIRPARAPREPSKTGLALTDFDFASELTVWSYDKADYSIRMDVETGMLEQLLLEAELDEEAIEAFYSGQRARVSGQRARVSGQRARVSGQRVRMRDRGGD